MDQVGELIPTLVLNVLEEVNVMKKKVYANVMKGLQENPVK